ncbi:hypothetical protein [Propionicimonas sp.]|uniref:hypothetical protein n=1 Tax=Propionicimonas sp. TaxID=1955623 RepID=UPI0039E22AAD
MSYSVSVYAARSVPAATLRAQFGDAAAFEQVEATRLEHQDADGLLVIEGPLRVDPDDVPEAVLALTTPTHLYTFDFVDGIGHDLARRLADSLDGVLWDGEVLRAPAGALPGVVTPARDEPVEVVALSWFVPPRAATTPVRLLADAAQRWLPEALPDRFGDTEPFQARLSSAGRPGLEQAWRTRSDDLLFTCDRLPAVEGSIGTPRRGNAAPMWDIELQLLGAPFHDESWRRRLQEFFIGLAESAGAVYAMAEVLGGYTLSRGRLWHQGESEAGRPWSPEGFCGIAGHPVWWSWFGAGYLPLVADRLAHPSVGWRVAPTATGTLLSLSTEPAGARELQPRLLGLRRPGGWFAPALLPRPSSRWKTPARVLPAPAGSRA